MFPIIIIIDFCCFAGTHYDSLESGWLQLHIGRALSVTRMYAMNTLVHANEAGTVFIQQCFKAAVWAGFVYIKIDCSCYFECFLLLHTQYEANHFRLGVLFITFLLMIVLRREQGISIWQFMVFSFLFSCPGRLLC